MDSDSEELEFLLTLLHFYVTISRVISFFWPGFRCTAHSLATQFNKHICLNKKWSVDAFLSDTTCSNCITIMLFQLLPSAPDGVWLGGAELVLPGPRPEPHLPVSPRPWSRGRRWRAALPGPHQCWDHQAQGPGSGSCRRWHLLWLSSMLVW